MAFWFRFRARFSTPSTGSRITIGAVCSAPSWRIGGCVAVRRRMRYSSEWSSPKGFIAVEAEDAAEVKSVGRAVLRLSRALGVEQWALRRSRSITEHAERNDWPAVRKEWDGVLPDVQQGMKELKSEHQAHLVSLGGMVTWHPGSRGAVVQNYSREDASLLRQPVLLDYLEKRLATLTRISTRSRAWLRCATEFGKCDHSWQQTPATYRRKRSEKMGGLRESFCVVPKPSVVKL